MVHHRILILSCLTLIPLSANASDTMTIEAGSFQMGQSAHQPLRSLQHAGQRRGMDRQLVRRRLHHGTLWEGRSDGPSDGKRKVVRGGSWDENRPNLRSSYRNVKPPESGDNVYGSIGFRCAYTARDNI